MSDAPERIWLQDDGDFKGAQAAWAEITWCESQVKDADTEYVRADLCDPLADPRVRALMEAVDRYNQAAEAIGGCGDGGCVVHRPGGQHTNGGCRCTYRMDETRQREVTKLLLQAQGIVKARAALAALKGGK
jgi:hypothetical protein